MRWNRGLISSAGERNLLVPTLSNDDQKSSQYRADAGISERKLCEGYLATGDATAALRHADEAVKILCASVNGGQTPNLINCDRSLLAAGNAYLGLHNSLAARLALQKSETIASSQSQADPANAVMRSDLARAQAALAVALAQSGDKQPNQSMYERAVDTWSILRQRNSITAADLQRSNETILALANLRPRQ